MHSMTRKRPKAASGESSGSEPAARGDGPRLASATGTAAARGASLTRAMRYLWTIGPESPWRPRLREGLDAELMEKAGRRRKGKEPQRGSSASDYLPATCCRPTLGKRARELRDCFAVRPGHLADLVVEDPARSFGPFPKGDSGCRCPGDMSSLASVLRRCE